MTTKQGNGSILAEFLLILPIIIMLIALTIELSIRTRRIQVVSNAAYFGAMEAAHLTIPSNYATYPACFSSNLCALPTFNEIGEEVSAPVIDSIECHVRSEVYRFLHLKENFKLVKPDSMIVNFAVKESSEVNGKSLRLLEVQIYEDPDKQSCIFCYKFLFKQLGVMAASSSIMLSNDPNICA